MFCEIKTGADAKKQVLLNIAQNMSANDQEILAWTRSKQHIVFASGDVHVIFFCSFHLAYIREGTAFSDSRVASSAALCQHFLSFDKV